MDLRIFNKVINYLTLSGKSTTSSKLLKKSIKEINKTTKKPFLRTFKLSVKTASPMFKLHADRNKTKKRHNKNIRRTMVAIITNSNTRTCSSIRLLVRVARSQSKHKAFIKAFANELLTSAKNQGKTVELKNETQQKVIHLRQPLKHYRWS